MKVFIALLLAFTSTSISYAGNVEDISALLETIREKHNLPALTAAVFNIEGITASGVTGVRKAGEKQKATINDLWHLGSDTKAITATLAGTFVVEGSLKWDDPVTKIFPEFASRIDPALKNITITDLLSHRAGLIPNATWASYARTNLKRERQNVAEQLLTAPPASAVGEYVYSNAGYVVAAAILEKISKKSWEELMRDRIFKPLNMKNIGFGGTGTPGRIDQPWPHLENGKPTASNGPNVDNPPVMGPAGTCHASLEAWVAFLSDQLRGATGEKALLPAQIYEFIQSPHPADASYGLGWGIADRPWAGGKVLSHNGSNTMNLAICRLAIPKKIGIIVCTNQAGESANKATEEVVTLLRERLQLNTSEQ